MLPDIKGGVLSSGRRYNGISEIGEAHFTSQLTRRAREATNSGTVSPSCVVARFGAADTRTAIDVFSTLSTNESDRFAGTSHSGAEHRQAFPPPDQQQDRLCSGSTDAKLHASAKLYRAGKNDEPRRPAKFCACCDILRNQFGPLRYTNPFCAIIFCSPRLPKGGSASARTRKGEVPQARSFTNLQILRLQRRRNAKSRFAFRLAGTFRSRILISPF